MQGAWNQGQYVINKFNQALVKWMDGGIVVTTMTCKFVYRIIHLAWKFNHIFPLKRPEIEDNRRLQS